MKLFRKYRESGQLKWIWNSNSLEKRQICKGKLILFIIIISNYNSIIANQDYKEPYWRFSISIINDTVPTDSTDDVVKITRTWDLPASLKNISAIRFFAPGKLACIQDEVGSIYIYNLETKEIEKEFPFGPPGDYEGLVLLRNDAYVACADGRILEILNYQSEKPEVKEYGTHLTVTENVNGLCYDRKNKRLLVSIKGNEDADEHYKGIYSFSIASKRMPVKPAVRIDLNNHVFNGLQPKNVQTVFQPSDLDINPVNGQLYIIDGMRGQLLRMKLSESIRNLTDLNKNVFFQPEGITFTPSGEIFIASKGVRDEPGMLMQVRIR